MDNDASVIVLHNSCNYLVIDKPYDMLINSNDSSKNTLQTEMRKMFPDLANPDLKHEFHFVHRLDYATSGVICIALNRNAARAASAAFEKRCAKKYYLAIVHGYVQQPSFLINKAIGHDVREIMGNRKMCTSDDIHCKKPRDCSTGLLVLERGLKNGKPATKVLLRPGTGRRHQLRVHCFHIGHTIVGDYTYSNRQDLDPHRTFLHSFRLILKNDIESLDIQTPDPFAENDWVPAEILQSLNEESLLTIDKLFL